jgi:hypothetical protein
MTVALKACATPGCPNLTHQLLHRLPARAVCDQHTPHPRGDMHWKDG